MDLDAPPPSYEVATGTSGSQQPLNPHFSRSPFYDEKLKAVVSTTPILSQSYHSRPTQPVRPYNPISYPAIRISPQTNNISHRPQSKSSSKTCICFFTLLMLVIALIMILVILGIKNSKPKATIYINTQSSDDTKYHVPRDWEAKSRQNNLDMFKRLDKYDDYLLQKRRDESRWNFNTHQDND